MQSATRNVAAAAAVVVGFIFTNTATARPPVSIRTGSNLATDGYLEVQPDEYGSWAANFTGAPFGPNADRYKPAGSPLNTPTFTNGFFLFAPGGQRELLSDNANWQATTNGTTGAPPFSADTSLNRAVTSANVASDANGDGINDTLTSSFRVFSPAPGTDLGFQLNQRVATGPGAVSFMRQNYTVTNNGTAPITIGMVRAWDGDLLWDNNFETDSVGTGANGGGVGPYVFMQEPTNAAQSITLSIPTGNAYYGGKHGVDPDGAGAGLPYDFGTDTEIWDNNGLLATWMNHIAGVGYNTDGQSGASPPGSTTQRDAFMGMDLSLTLAPGQSQSFTVFHTYGQTSPIPEPAALGLVAASAGLLLRRRHGA